MHVKILLAVLSLFILSCSALDPCQNKDLFLKKHKDFVEQTLDSKKEFSKNDWNERDENFDQLVNECYKNVEADMTKEEKKEYWITNSKYLAARIKEDSDQSIESLTGIIESLSSDGVDFAEGLNEFLGEDLKTTFEDFEGEMKDIFDEDFKEKLAEVFNEEFRQDLKKTFKDLGEQLKEMGEELKEIVEEK